MCAAIYVSDSIEKLLHNAKSPIQEEGDTVFECLKNFVIRYPAIRPYLLDDRDQLTPFINVYLNGKDVRFLKDKELQLNPTDKIEIIPSLSGG